jgi:hypothetical protein
MKLNSKIQIAVAFLFMVITLTWIGCSQQQPTAASVANPTVDKYSLFAFTAANVGLVPGNFGTYTNISKMINKNLYTESSEPAITTSNSFAKVSGYGMTPITVLSGPLPISFASPTPSYDPEGHLYVANAYTTSPAATPMVNNVIWPGYYEYYIIPTGLPDAWDQYGVSITGFINDPEDPAYPPGPGNPDPIEFEYYPYFNGTNTVAGFNGAQAVYDLTPFQGLEFYVYIDPTDDAVDRLVDINTLQQQPGSQTPSGDCDNPSWPNIVHCYDPFQYDFTNAPKGQWVLIQEPWAAFKQYGFGSVQSPPTLSGTNLQQCFSILWIETNASVAGPINIKFALAGMRFY